MHDFDPAGGNRLFNLCIEGNLDVSESNTTWHADLNFKSCPSFLSVFRIHAVFNDGGTNVSFPNDQKNRRPVSEGLRKTKTVEPMSRTRQNLWISRKCLSMLSVCFHVLS